VIVSRPLDGFFAIFFDAAAAAFRRRLFQPIADFRFAL